MKQQDKNVLSLLRENSRMSLTEMSKRTNIPISTLFEKLKNYNSSLIKKNTTIIDFSKLGYDAKAKILIKVRKNFLQELREQLIASPNLNDLHRVNNGFDFMAEFIFKTAKEMEDYLDTISGKYEFEREERFYVIDELKREEFLSKSKLV